MNDRRTTPRPPRAADHCGHRFRSILSAVILLIGLSLIGYGLLRSSYEVHLPPESADETASEPPPAVEALSAEWSMGLESSPFGEPMTTAAIEPTPAPPVETPAPASQWRGEPWLIRAATVGGIARDEGGQLLQTYAEGEIPSLCPT